MAASPLGPASQLGPAGLAYPASAACKLPKITGAVTGSNWLTWAGSWS